MRAIAAILSRDRALVEPGELAAMCASAGSPAAESYCLEVRPGVAVAACGAEPARSIAEENGLLLTLDGRLDNRRELATSLELPASLDEAPLLLAAYRRWGEALVDRLAGDFAFVLWDARAERLICGRDPLGMRPLHYARCGDRLLVASEAHQIAGHPAVGARPDLGAVGAYLMAQPVDPARSFYEGVAGVPQGQILVSRRGVDQLRRYWRPEEIEVEAVGIDDATERLRELLWRAVEDRIGDSAAPTGLLLSGGLDSSAVAAVAVDILSRRGAEGLLLPFCFTFEELAECDESAYRRQLADHLGIRVEKIGGAGNGLLDRPLLRWPESPAQGWQALVEEALEQLRLRRGDVLLTGFGGDAVLAGSACVYADRLRRGDLGVWREMAEHATVRGASLAGVARHWGLRPLLPRPFRGHLAGDDGLRRLPAWIDPRWARRVGLDRLKRERSAEPSFRSRARRAIHGALGGLAGERAAAHWLRRLAGRHGIRVRHPFLDRRLVELVLAMPPELLFRAGRYKRLVRRALGDRLPDRVRNRVGKTGYGPFVDLSMRRQVPWIRGLLRSSRLVEMGVLRLDRLAPELDEYLEGRSTRLRPHLWAIITCEVWIRRFMDPAGEQPATLSVVGTGS